MLVARQLGWFVTVFNLDYKKIKIILKDVFNFYYKSKI